ALRTLGTFRMMSASRRFPRSRFQPGIPAMYAWTGTSPFAFAMRGLPPERTTATCSPFRALIGLASRAPGLAFAPACAVPLLLVVGFRYDKVAAPPRHTSCCRYPQTPCDWPARQRAAHRAAMMLNAHPTSAPAG